MSADKATLLVGKWFLGIDLPIPNAGGDSANPDSTGGYPYAQSTGSLGTPEASDVNQGTLGTCYLLAALGAIADKAPQYITNAIIDNGNGSFGIRFFTGGQEQWITVNLALPVHSNQKIAFASANESYSLAGENWVSLFEKAYAQLKGNSFAGIDLADSPRSRKSLALHIIISFTRIIVNIGLMPKLNSL